MKKYGVEELQGELEQALGLLESEALFSYTPEEAQNLRARAAELLQKLHAIEGRTLTIGLLGGTGVGKSTLMNALAGSEIASTSHRRPHTDHVLIYRHKAVSSLQDLHLDHLPWREIIHEVEAVQQVLLCDLPDFDSLVGEHRQWVLDFLEHLDVLVWVLSPEKYADARFYEFLDFVPKAKKNFLFVLNKVDLLFEGITPQAGYGQLEKVSKSLEDRLREGGIEEPFLYTLSAQMSLEGDSSARWNQFNLFKQQIFQQRDLKQIRAVKTANLDVEVRQFLALLQRETKNLKAFEKLLETEMETLKEALSSWDQAAQEAFELWVSKYIRPGITLRQGDPSRLVGPGYIIALVLEAWQRSFTKAGESSVDAPLPIMPGDVSAVFRQRLQWLEERLQRRVLQPNLPHSFVKSIQDSLNVERALKDLQDRSSTVLAFGLEAVSLPRFRVFKAVQVLVYGIVFVLFIVALGGETAWRDVITAPGGRSIINLLLSGIKTLFGGRGLAAMGSFALINLFLGFRFYRAYRRRLERRGEKTARRLKVALREVWLETVKTVLTGMDRLREDVKSRAESLSTLGKE